MAKLYDTFKNGNAIVKLIYVNSVLFLLYLAIHLILTLLNILDDNNIILNVVALQSKWDAALKTPWGILSYMFFHKSIPHILFNMLGLYWFGKIFLNYFNEKQLFGLYLLGGIGGGLLFLLAFNTLPYFKAMEDGAPLIGASASIMAIIAGIACYNPNYEIKIAFFGKIKLLYIAIAFLIISFYNISNAENAGGNIAHIGGFLIGWIFALRAKKGKDLTKGINKAIDLFVNLFSRKPKMKVAQGPYKSSVSDKEWNKAKKAEETEMDAILDKVKRSGYNSLTIEEKKKLFDTSK